MYRLFSVLRQIVYFISNPFRGLRWRISAMRPRPMLRLRQSFSGMRGNINWLNSLLPKRMRQGKKKASPDEGIEVSSKPLPTRRRRARQITRQEYAQVHLVHASGDRKVLHIGSSVGYHAAEITLEDGHPAATLRFTQEDVAPEAVVRLALAAGVERILVDDKALERRSLPLPVKTGTRIAIGDHTYTAELFTADEAAADVGIDAFWTTSSGIHHDLNEDAIGIGRHESGYLFAVADGVQGGYAGERVSEFAMCYLLLVFKKNVPHHFPWAKVFERALTEINKEVRRFAERSPDHAGTTLTAVVVQGWMVHVAHVGDSRLYLLRRGRLRQLTTDHVVTEKPVAVTSSGGTAAQTTKYPRLRKAIGKDDPIEPDIFSFTLQPGDRLLLCTDGVSDAFTDETLRAMLQSSPRNNIPQELIVQANTREKPDNATAVLIDARSQPSAESWWDTPPQPRVYTSNRVFAARLDHSTSYETVYRPAPRRINWTLVAVVAVVLCLVLSIAGMSWAAAQLTSAGSTPPTGQVQGGPDAAGTTLPPDETPETTVEPSQTPTATRIAPTIQPSPTIPFPPTSTIRPSNERAKAIHA